MSHTSHYSDYRWIKVPRSKPVEIDGEKYVTEEHHITETQFLIAEIRKLAEQMDDLRSTVGDAICDIPPCQCEPSWLRRGKHSPDCLADVREYLVKAIRASGVDV